MRFDFNRSLCPKRDRQTQLFSPIMVRVQNMRNVPPDEYNGAVVYLQYHGHRITPVESFASSDPATPGTRVSRKTLTAEEVVSLAVNEGWVLP